MIEIEKKFLIFSIKEICFADYPFEVAGKDAVIFYDCKNKIEKDGFARKEFPTLIIDLTKDLEDIWRHMDRKSCRYMIQRAQKEGIKIRVDQDYDEFNEINASFRKKKDSGSVSDVKEYKNYGKLFTAEIGGEIVGGQFYLEDKQNIKWLLGASKRLEVEKEKAILIGCANRLMIWEAIKYAKARGIKEFDLGGYYTGKMRNGQKEKINDFKKSFGGQPTTHYIYQKNYSKIYKLLSLLKKRLSRGHKL